MLDNFFKSPMELIDIDMFGSEIDVLKGAQETIIKYKPELLIKLHEDRIMKERERIIGFLAYVLGLPINIKDELHGDGAGGDSLRVSITDNDKAVSYFRGRRFEYYRNRGPEPIMYFTGWTTEVRLREKLLRPDEVVYDLGAHIGGWTIPAALVSKKVYAFEPNIDCCDILRDNLTLNNLKNVEVINIALTGSKKAPIIKSCYNDNNTSQWMKLDDIWIDDPPDLIKIDVEGAELEVLRGAQEVIKTFKPRIFVEAHTIDGYNTYDDVMKMVMELVPDYHTEVDEGSWCIFYI